MTTYVTTPINNGDTVDAVPIKSNYDAIIAALNSFDGANIQTGSIPDTAMTISPEVIRNEMFNDYVVTGLTTALPSNSLTAATTSGTALINGKRINLAAGTNNTFAINATTYIDLRDTGIFNYTTNVSPDANSIRLAKVVTDGTKITAVTDMRALTLVPNGLIQTAAIADDAVTTDKMGLTVSAGTASPICNTGIYRFGNFKFETGFLALNNGTTGWQQYNVTFKELWIGAPTVFVQNYGVNGSVETDNTSQTNILAVYNDIFVLRVSHSNVNYGNQLHYLAIGPA